MEPTRLRDVFAVLNEMEGAGVVSRWAVVGAVGALFHAPVSRTYDLDVAVLLPVPSGTILSLGPIYEWLARRGFAAEGEHVRIHGVPVQFLSGDPPLWREAVEESRRFDYEGQTVPVASAEHLVALALEAPSARRRERAALLRESAALDLDRLRSILSRHRISVPEGWDV